MTMGRHTAHETQQLEELFIRAFATTGSSEAAARAAGYAASHAKEQGRRFMQRASIAERAHAAREAERQRASDSFDEQQHELKRKASAAIAMLAKIVEAPTDAYLRGAQARVQAATAILDRAGHMPVQRIEADVTARRAVEDIDADTARAVMRLGLDAMGAHTLTHDVKGPERQMLTNPLTRAKLVQDQRVENK